MTGTNRRSYPRQLRRVQVRFQRVGEERSYSGFTKNLSLSGALITAPDPAPRGSRIRLELMGKEDQAVVYAQVVHAHRVPREMRRFAESAMGVRFLSVEEVVAPFLPESRSGAGPQTGGGRHHRRRREKQAAARDPDMEETLNLRRPDAETPSTRQEYSLLFENPKDFLTVFHRDIANGGLFVSTSRPARLYDPVRVTLHLPVRPKRSVEVDARVVQVVEPRKAGGGRTAGGMGLEIIDPEVVLEKLEPVVQWMQEG